MPRWLRWALISVAGALVLVAAVTAVDLWRIRNDLEAGQQRLHHLGALSLDCQGGLAGVVGGAESRLRHADGLAHDDPGMALLAPLPVVGRQVASIRRLSRASAQLGGIAHQAAVRVQADLDQQRTDAAGRVALLDAMSAELSRVRAELAAVNAGPGRGLIPPLASARARFVSRVQSATTKLDRAYADVTVVRSLLAGPGDYLVLAANNAEMRGGAGAPLSAGVAHIEGGEIKLSPFQQTMDLFLPPEQAVPIPSNLTRLFDGYRMGYEWRNMTMTPNFPEVAPILAKMAQRARLGTVKGVFVVDAVALRDVLGVVGPVTLDDVTYDQNNVEAEVLNGDYYRHPNDREGRVSVQGRLASEAFKALTSRHISAIKLAQALANSAKGRHVMAWSPSPVLQSLWTQVGAAGTIRDDGLMVAVENVAANKLDWYVEPTVEMATQRQADGATKVSLDLTITNPAHGYLPFYIQGNDFGKGLSQYRAMIAFYLPNRAYNVGSPTGFYTASLDGPMKVAVMEVALPMGTTKKISVSFLLDRAATAVTLVPSARAHPMQYRFLGENLDDSVARTIPLFPAASAPHPAASRPASAAPPPPVSAAGGACPAAKH